MRFITEEETAGLITRDIAFQAARHALVAAAKDGVLFPAVIAHGNDQSNRFSVKAGAMDGALGVKIGSFWPNNPAQGLARHSSLILLFDEATGRINTVIEASLANAFRTAAANAVATSVLARRDAHTLTVFGAGRQAFHEVAALAAVRTIHQVLVVNRTRASTQELLTKLRAIGMAASEAEARAACQSADMVVTATASTQPLFDAGWIQPGTHISAMGADGPGKQELPSELLDRAVLFCDSPSQSIVIGEFQSIAGKVRSGATKVTAIGSVLLGNHPGRLSDRDITIFDSSGIALQDLALARHVIAQIDGHQGDHA